MTTSKQYFRLTIMESVIKKIPIFVLLLSVALPALAEVYIRIFKQSA
jgi:hypothetical protein